MNNKFGLVASFSALICTLLFLAGLFTRSDSLNYWSCLALSWAYIGTACALAQEAREDRKGVAAAGVAIGSVYSLLTNLVYYTQLTTVASGAADQEVLRVFSFRQGSWIFGLDLLGYGLMALSTLLIGLSMAPRASGDKALKWMLMLHGIFFPICVVMPVLDVFPEGSGGNAGIYALMGWCVYFAPVMALAVQHFRRQWKDRPTVRAPH
ncbi:MAG: putative rane protein [Paenibacillaceae bacterium]|jgi:hypothetical protein|nr:putative rane protein [Paenibacillaceae bacterium]